MNNHKAENIGRIIAEKRKAAGMTQETLASRLNITPQAVSKWENGVGLPDLTLIPQIASVLEISVAELFGENERPKGAAPESYMGMPLAYTDGKVAVYSNKSVQIVQDNGVVFTDGSQADITSATVTNCGEGEIRIFELADILPEVFEYDCEHDTVTKSFGETHSLNIINSAACKIEVVRGKERETVVNAEGSKRFISRLQISEAQGLLTVNAQQSSNHGSETGNRITIAVGYDRGKAFGAHINGCGEIKAQQSFDCAELVISGSGNINLRDLGTCDIRISGCGNIATEDVTDSLSVTISGSGDVACAHVRNVTVRIAGSGDLSVMKMDGFLNAKISGSGAIACSGGEMDSLNVGIGGSGELACGSLTVQEADISIRGSGNVSIGRIIKKSVEKLSKNCTLNVGKRG